MGSGLRKPHVGESSLNDFNRITTECGKDTMRDAPIYGLDPRTLFDICGRFARDPDADMLTLSEIWNCSIDSRGPRNAYRSMPDHRFVDDSVDPRPRFSRKNVLRGTHFAAYRCILTISVNLKKITADNDVRLITCLQSV